MKNVMLMWFILWTLFIAIWYEFDWKVQEFLYHGRAGVLPPQDLPLERTEARLAWAFPRPHPPKEEGKEPEQSRNALPWTRNEDGRSDRCSVNRVPYLIAPDPMYPFPATLFNLQCCILLLFSLLLPKNLRPRGRTLITGRSSHHPTSYRISVTAVICCLFPFPHWTRPLVDLLFSSHRVLFPNLSTFRP